VETCDLEDLLGPSAEKHRRENDVVVSAVEGPRLVRTDHEWHMGQQEDWVKENPQASSKTMKNRVGRIEHP
jgi:hypothetical protein